MVTRALPAVLLALAGISRAAAATPDTADPLTVPAGTLLHCRTNGTLTTKLNAQGDAFTFSLAEPVSTNGNVAIPAGAILAGRITQLDHPGRIKGVGQMRLSLERITLPNGSSFPVNASLMTVYGLEHARVVGSESLITGPSSRAPDLAEIGAGTAGGALLGLIFAHPFVGAAAGAAATTVDRMRRRGKDLTIPIGTELSYQLTRELTIGGNATAHRVRGAGD